LPAKGKKNLPIDVATHRLIKTESGRTGLTMEALVAAMWTCYLSKNPMPVGSSDTPTVPSLVAKYDTGSTDIPITGLQSPHATPGNLPSATPGRDTSREDQEIRMLKERVRILEARVNVTERPDPGAGIQTDKRRRGIKGSVSGGR
jgi:hypothetical protein